MIFISGFLRIFSACGGRTARALQRLASAPSWRERGSASSSRFDSVPPAPPRSRPESRPPQAAPFFRERRAVWWRNNNQLKIALY